MAGGEKQAPDDRAVVPTVADHPVVPAAELSTQVWSGMEQGTGTAIKRDDAAIGVNAVPADGSIEVSYGLFRSAKTERVITPVRTEAGREVVDLSAPISTDNVIRTVTDRAAAARSRAVTDVPASDGDRSVIPERATERKSREQKMFDPTVTPEEKIKIAKDVARDLVKEGKKPIISGPDGKNYAISSYSAGDRQVVSIFGPGTHSRHPMLRGVVNKDGTVSKQIARNGESVDIVGKWAKRNLPDDPMIKREAPKKVEPPQPPADQGVLVDPPERPPAGRGLVVDPPERPPTVRGAVVDPPERPPTVRGVVVEPPERPPAGRGVVVDPSERPPSGRGAVVDPRERPPTGREQRPPERYQTERGEYPTERSPYGRDEYRRQRTSPYDDRSRTTPYYDGQRSERYQYPRDSGYQRTIPEGRRSPVEPQAGDNPSKSDYSKPIPGDATQTDKPGQTPGDAKPAPTADSEFDYIKRNFQGFDQDGNEHVTADEVGKFIEANKGKLNDAETKTLTKFKENIGKLQKVHNDETGFENDGVTRADLDDGEKRMKAFEFADKNFAQIDGDGDGFLTETELTNYAKTNDAKLSAGDKTSLNYLKDNVSDIENFSNDETGFENDGITKKDLVEARKTDGSDQFRTRQPSDKDQLRLPDYKAPISTRTGIVSSEDFKKEALKLFDQLDSDKNGYLSTNELATAVQDEKYRDKDAQTVAALYAGREHLEEMHNDETGDENDGVTRKDLEEYDKLRKTDGDLRKSAAQAETWLQENDRFKTLDKDSDSFLSKSEINTALKDKNLSEKDKTNLEFLKKNYSMLEDARDDEWGVENDGITMKDLDYFGDSTTGRVINALNSTFLAQGHSRELYGGASNPIDNIKPDAIKQGMIGDCYFESAVASIAATQPELIKNMIQDNHDGTFTVTFQGDKDQPITVKAPTEAEMGIYNRGGAHGVWANVLEKAYGKYCQENFSHRGPARLGGGNTPTEGGDGGEVFHGRAMSLLTGSGRNTDNLSFTSTATLKQRLTDALTGDNKRPVIAGINNGVGETTDDGFFKAHAYSVTAFDPNGPDGGTVTIRNPWGGADDSTRGTKKISLKQFQKNFSDVSYSDK